MTIISSRQDPASANIARNLIARHGFVEQTQGEFSLPDHMIRIVFVEKLGIYVEPEDIPRDSSTIIFASNHVSATNIPAMTVHATGNLTSTAEFGGNPEEVSFVEPGDGPDHPS